jgi:nucleotide-binding universal stress UspA family protein
MIEKVLIPLDGSKVGEAALPVIEKLATILMPETKIEVTLLGVVTQLRHWVVVGEASAPISYNQEELKAIEERVFDYLDKAGATLRGRGATVNIRVTTGNAPDEILKVAEEIGVNLIAMSTHGRSGLSRLAFGSVTDKVLRGAGIPVLMVRAPVGTANA